MKRRWRTFLWRLRGRPHRTKNGVCEGCGTYALFQFMLMEKCPAKPHEILTSEEVWRRQQKLHPFSYDVTPNDRTKGENNGR